MQRFLVNFKGIEPSEALEAYSIRRLSNAIVQYRPVPTNVQITFGQRDQVPTMECIVSWRGGVDERIEDCGRYLYDCVDRTATKLQAMTELMYMGGPEHDFKPGVSRKNKCVE